QDLQVEGVRIWFPEARLRPPTANAAKVREIDRPVTGTVQVVGEYRMTADVDSGAGTYASLHIGRRDEPVTRPVYLPGYIAWEHALGHHDPLTDIFSLGQILATLTCGVDLTDPEELNEFVRRRRSLFELNPHLHPVIAKAVVRMTELSRHRRPQ